MTGYVMDTSAWIEYFRGSLEGEKVKEYIFPEPTEILPLITSTIVITEMRSKYIREEKQDVFFEDLDRIRSLSTIEDEILEENAILAGTKHGKTHTNKNNISYVDCILWTLAEKRNMKVLSIDKHFKDCPNAIYIQKENLK